ncbi:MAG: SCO family protein [Rhodoblastus sp.]
MALLRTIFCAAAAVAIGLGGSARAERLDAASVHERSEAAIGRAVGDYTLTDSNGEKFKLSSYRGQPVVLSLIYTSCSSVCPPTTQHLRTAVANAQSIFGADRFAVVTLGFDARSDTPARMAGFKATQGVDAPNWRFASADAVTISELLRDVGFSYSTAAGGFEHITQTTIIDPQGKVYRQVYGEDFPLQVFMEPLKEAVFGLAATSLSLNAIVDRIRFVCTVYDANSGHYRTSYATFIGIGVGALSLLLCGWAIASTWRSARLARDAREAAKSGQPSAGATR